MIPGAGESERMVVAAARELADGEVCFVGIGVPSLAAVLAKKTHAPGLTLVYESGAIGSVPPVPPLSTGSPSVVDGVAMVGDCLTVFGSLQAGYVDVGLLSAAQVDRRGNLNSTVIGPYLSPKVRLVGSGGAHDIASLARRVVIVMPHDPRRFVPRVDFVTTPGHPDTGAAPLGPSSVVTPRGRFVFVDGEMTLWAVHEGYTGDDAVEGLEWAPPRADPLEKLSAPTESELRVLREEVDVA